ncbi:MAG: hypothetical protein JSS30_00985 [Verrucomicrobia bacterium]|nr:hypothetical protein [Verrucomicrobiota bacterium]
MIKLLAALVFLYGGDLAEFTQQPTTTESQSGVNFYQRLHISSEEKRKIAEILTTMANNSVFQLLFERKYLERLGQEVHHVHPIRFLGTIFTDPHLVRCMFTIRMSGFKWGGFVDGITERMKGEIKAGNVDLYVPGFAEQLNLRAADIQSYIDRRDIEGLVLFLMDKKRN